MISFVQRFDGLSFLDALRLLAQACGEELPETTVRRRSRGEEKRLEALHDVLSRAQRFYADKLWQPEGAAALAYARERGFRDETLKAFGCGWAPAQGSPLLEVARRAKIDEGLLVDAGLVRRSDDGRAYDFFRGRWLVPILDRLGRTVGFGGRHLPGDTKAHGKYVNTPETRLFHKGRLVFGLSMAQDAVRKARHIVLVEGYTDVMAAHQCGLEQVAAVLGTSTTEDHAALIRRSGASRVTLVFDGDEAGRKASLRALAGLLPLDLRLDVVAPAAGVDPCDLLMAEGGAERFGALLDDAREWFGWLVDGLTDLHGAELASGVDELFLLLRKLSRPVEQDARLVELAGRLGLSEDALRRQWSQTRARGARRAEPAPVADPAAAHEPSQQDLQEARDASDRSWGDEQGAPQPAPRPVDPRVSSAFGGLLGAMLLDNSLIPVYGEWVEQCPDEDLALLLRTVHELYENDESGEPIHAGLLMTELGDHPVRDRVVALEARARTAESPMVLARDQDAWLRRRMEERDVLRMRQKLRQTEHASPRSHQETEGAADPNELLRSLHQKLRQGRVPEPAPITPEHEAHQRTSANS